MDAMQAPSFASQSFISRRAMSFKESKKEGLASCQVLEGARKSSLKVKENISYSAFGGMSWKENVEEEEEEENKRFANRTRKSATRAS
eukprot:5773438-Pyramimonas_sp.AAC.1